MRTCPQDRSVNPRGISCSRYILLVAKGRTLPSQICACLGLRAADAANGISKLEDSHLVQSGELFGTGSVNSVRISDDAFDRLTTLLLRQREKNVKILGFLWEIRAELNQQRERRVVAVPSHLGDIITGVGVLRTPRDRGRTKRAFCERRIGVQRRRTGQPISTRQGKDGF
jgi:hypothetical protein